MLTLPSKPSWCDESWIVSHVMPKWNDHLLLDMHGSFGFTHQLQITVLLIDLFFLTINLPSSPNCPQKHSYFYFSHLTFADPFSVLDDKYSCFVSTTSCQFLRSKITLSAPTMSIVFVYTNPAPPLSIWECAYQLFFHVNEVKVQNCRCVCMCVCLVCVCRRDNGILWHQHKGCMVLIFGPTIPTCFLLFILFEFISAQLRVLIKASTLSHCIHWVPFSFCIQVHAHIQPLGIFLCMFCNLAGIISIDKKNYSIVVREELALEFNQDLITFGPIIHQWSGIALIIDLLWTKTVQ